MYGVHGLQGEHFISKDTRVFTDAQGSFAMVLWDILTVTCRVVHHHPRAGRGGGGVSELRCIGCGSRVQEWLPARALPACSGTGSGTGGAIWDTPQCRQCRQWR